MQKYKEARNSERENQVHTDKEKRAQENKHKIRKIISTNVDYGFFWKYGDICYNWRTKNSIRQGEAGTTGPETKV